MTSQHFPMDALAQRPGMRRKSSAQNLLTSFKPQTNTQIPPPLNLAPSTGGSSGTLSFSSVGAGGTTPLASTPVPKTEWDSQSMHSETLAGAQSPQLGAQGTSVEYLRELVMKRIITLTYLRNIHDGQGHWFHTIQMSRSDLERTFNNAIMKKRTNRFAILALSLGALLEINQPQDLLKGVLNTITEYEQSKEEGDGNKSKMRLKFRPKTARKGGSTIAEYPGTFSDSSDASYLFSPSMPFPLDYHQTLLSFLDVLSEVYNKISKLLGPSPFPLNSQLMMGPLAGVVPQPGVSYLFSGQSGLTSNGWTTPQHQSHTHLPSIFGVLNEGQSLGSLWDIANGPPVGSAGMMFHNAGLGGPPVNWTSALGEMVLKIDGKFKKITTALLKDLDEFARNKIKDELASLDPKNLGGLATFDGN